MFHKVFDFYDYWNRSVDYQSFHSVGCSSVGLGSTRMDSRVEYNSCFYNRSAFANDLIRTPLRQVFKSPDLLLSTNCPLFYAVVRNPENYQRLLELGLVDPRLGNLDVQAFFLLSKVLRTYVVPHPDVLDEVNAALAPYAGRYLVGMHIRCGNPLSDFRDQSTFIRSGRLSAFSRCVKGIESAEKSRAIALVLASDSTRAKKTILSHNPKLEVASKKGRAVHTMLKSGQKPPSRGVKDVFVEMLLLARCQKLIGTQRSTFSLCAAAFQGQLPLLVGLKAGACSIPKQIVFG